MAANAGLPTQQEALRDWATGVVIAEGQRGLSLRLAVAEKATTVTGVVPDPVAACDRAVRDVAAKNGIEDPLLERAAVASTAAASAPLFIDWADFWKQDVREADWVLPDVLARGRGHALYGAHKSGKSLFSLGAAATLATSGEPLSVLYLDFEMTGADVRERLEDMGYGPGTDLSHLHYASLPPLPPFDTAEGAAALADILDRLAARSPERHIVAFIDTVSRAVAGEENSADTYRAFYNHTGIELKRRGVTWCRLDHAGKDSDRGQRGSSAKGDDVDIVWKLTPTENGIVLKRELTRLPWVPERVVFRRTDYPLQYLRLAEDWPGGTGELANILDCLDVPLDATTREAQRALATIGQGRRRELVVAAVKWRRDKGEEQITAANCGSGTTLAAWGQNHMPEPPSTDAESKLEPAPEPAGTSSPDMVGTGFPPLRGNRSPVLAGGGEESGCDAALWSNEDEEVGG